MNFKTFLLFFAGYISLNFGLIHASNANGYLNEAETAYCLTAAQREERMRDVPDALIQALSVAESGRRNEATRQLVAWPWTVMAEKEGRFYASKSEAVEAVKELQRRGTRNIDVGCMQINLMHHGDAFDSVESALEPSLNVAYGAKYLSALHNETGSWFTALKRYHSAKPKFHLPYRGRVFRIWRDIKQRHLSLRRSRPMTEIAFAENSELMSTDIRDQAFNNPRRRPPVILESRKNRWSDAFKQAETALSTLKD